MKLRSFASLKRGAAGKSRVKILGMVGGHDKKRIMSLSNASSRGKLCSYTAARGLTRERT